MELTVREMIADDIESIVDYFVKADASFLIGMGAEKSKLPKREDWIKKLNAELNKSIEQNEFYYIIWLIDGSPVGHSNINSIVYGRTAMLHLHMWSSDKRARGLGVKFVEMALPFYFKSFKLESLVCEPYAENLAPIKVLKQLGFRFIRTYETTPGWINFKQYVSRYEMTNSVFTDNFANQ